MIVDIGVFIDEFIIVVAEVEEHFSSCSPFEIEDDDDEISFPISFPVVPLPRDNVDDNDDDIVDAANDDGDEGPSFIQAGSISTFSAVRSLINVASTRSLKSRDAKSTLVLQFSFAVLLLLFPCCDICCEPDKEAAVGNDDVDEMLLLLLFLFCFPSAPTARKGLMTSPTIRNPSARVSCVQLQHFETR